MEQTVSLDKYIPITDPDGWAGEAWQAGRVLVLCFTHTRDGAALLTFTDYREPDGDSTAEAMLVLLNGVDLLGDPQAVALLVPKTADTIATLATLMDLVAGVDPR
jgi:hypothetical protein